MAFDGFMWFEEPNSGAPPVEGETLDKTYKAHKAFDLKSFSLDVENPCSIGSGGGGGGTGRAKLNPFKVTKWTDNCSPSLFKACCVGGHYGKACIVVRKAGSSADTSKAAGMEYLRYSFYVVFVTNIEWSGDSGDELPGDTVTFAYGAMQIEYFPQTQKGGKANQPNIQQWDQVTNAADITVPDPG
jgi:type VI secretion system secreted protein Hcp